MILVGGPAVNDLTQELAQANQTMERREYEENQAIIQLVEGAFSEGNDALIVAGHSGEDTQEASTFLSNYDENSDRLSGQSQVNLETGDSETPEVEEEDTDDNQTQQENETSNQTENETENQTNEGLEGDIP